MGRWLNDKLPRVTIPTDEISEAHWQQLLHKGMHTQSSGKKSMRMWSAQQNTVTKWKVIRSCLTRAAPYKVIQKKGYAVIIEDQEWNTERYTTQATWKSLSSQTLIITPQINRRVGHQPQKHQKKLNWHLQQSLPNILPSLLKQWKLLLLFDLLVLDSLPLGWKTLCVLSSHMFLTLPWVNKLNTVARHLGSSQVRYYWSMKLLRNYYEFKFRTNPGLC